MSPASVAVIAVVVAVAALGHTVAGFGFSLLAVPLLGLVIDPKGAVVTATVLLVLASGLLAWRERDRVDWQVVRPLLLGALPGMPVGLVVLEAISVDALRLGLVALALTSVATVGSGLRVRRTGHLLELVAGFATGVLTTTVNANGPPTVLALQARGLPPAVFRPTTSAVLGLASAVGASLFLAAGRMSGETAAATAVAAPAVVLGWWVGSRLEPLLPPEVFRRLVLVLLVGATCATAASVVA